MRNALKERLERDADRKGYTGARKNKFVHGTLATIRKQQQAKHPRAETRAAKPVHRR